MDYIYDLYIRLVNYKSVCQECGEVFYADTPATHCSLGCAIASCKLDKVTSISSDQIIFPK